MFGRKRGSEPVVVPGRFAFTDGTRHVLANAREEAGRLHHDYVGTEHILLGLTREGEGVATAVLASFSVRLDAVRERVEARVPRARAEAGNRDLPYTSRAKKVLEFAMAEARELNHAHVGTEHLLLGLLREKRGIAAGVLDELGVTLSRTRAEVVRLLGGTGPVEPESEFTVEIDDGSDVSIYEQIVAGVQEAVATGRLQPGERLPPVRRLADRLDIAPGTVARAYGELERLGVVVTEGARGTRVADRPPNPMPDGERPETLVGLLRPVAVAAFHLGATAAELRQALEAAMRGIFAEGQERGT